MEGRQESSWALERVVIGGLTRLHQGITTIGRSGTCSITITSDYVSRTHAEFQVVSDCEDIYIKDLDSTNGIFVNDTHINKTTCRLLVNDRIGIGVSVEDDEISPDGKYPIFRLRRIPHIVNNTVVIKQNEIPDNNPNALIVPASPSLANEDANSHAEGVNVEISDSEYDDDDQVDDFVPPQGNKNFDMEKCIASSPHPPQNIAKARSIVIDDIRSIFGDFNRELLDNLSEGTTRAIAEAGFNQNVLVPVMAVKDIICISSDEECDDNRQKTNKSPQLFGDSFNNDDDAEFVVEAKPDVLAIADKTDEPKAIAAASKLDDVDENEEDELYFTQRHFDELREELPDSNNEMTSDYKVNENGLLILAPIKQEKLSQSVDTIINLDDDDVDDDEYDEALESKVNDWSFKLFSQSFSNSYNNSQIYEDDEDNAPAATTEGVFVEIDAEKEEHDMIVEQQTDVVPNEPSVSNLINLPLLSDGETVESQPIRPIKRCWNNKKILLSSSSEEETVEEQAVHLGKNTTSTSSLKNEIRTRKESTSDEIPKKKPRFSSKSEEHLSVTRAETPKLHRRSSSLKTYSKENFITKEERSLKEDIFEKLKKDSQCRPSSETTDERSNSNDISGSSIVAYRRSSSAVVEPLFKISTSANLVRRKSLGNQLSVDDQDSDNFEAVKTPQSAQTTQSAKIIRGPPEIIVAPQLPSTKGRLRGVSAVPQKLFETAKLIHPQKDLNRKWKVKSSDKEKAKSKAIKEDRKQKLKELADKKQSEIVNIKQKVGPKDNEKEKIVKKKLNVKVTSVNRGAFLIEQPTAGTIKSYKIPKTNSKSSKSNDPKPIAAMRKFSSDIATNFSIELSKSDALLETLHKQQSISTISQDRQKSIDEATEQKERAPIRRNNKKLTFKTMEEQFVEKSRLNEIQEKLARVSSMKSPFASKKKKTVRFNDLPEIRYIEPVLRATRKVDKKEPSTFNERRNFIRRRFHILDNTDDLLCNVLTWSQLWLLNKQTGFNMDGTDDVLFPMINQFTSISNYKNTVFPLMKIEYLSHLERHMQRHASQPGFKVRVDYFTQHKDRELIIAKCSAPIKSTDLSVSDLALIDIVIGSSTSQYFGYIGNIRKTETCNCITIEVSRNLIPKDNLKNGTKITIRRIIEAIRVYFGSFNAVYQLEQTPLFEKILNPLSLLNVKTQWKPSIQYKGCDALNPEQTEILLKTYAKCIDDYNPNISLIKGPPGTGKSRLITNLALQLLYGNEVRRLDKKILICAQSNMAVDVIAQQLHAIQKKLSPRVPKYQVIRFGKDEKVHKDVRDITVSKLIERDHKARLQQKSRSDEQTEIELNLNNEILNLEARVTELQKDNIQDVRQDELIEMRKSLALKKSIQNQSLRQEDERRLFATYLGNANIICTTLSSCVKLSHYVNYFDVCIIDEATQCTEPWTIMPLKFGVYSLIMVGDTQQLPATIISQKAKEYGLGMSLFTRIQNCLESNKREEPNPILSLHTQYRMHPEICKWPNAYFYKNQLINSPNTTEFKSQIKPFSILNLEYRQNERCHNGQITNTLEAEFVIKLVMTLNQYIPNKYFSYGIITPYAQHREKLESMIRNKGLRDIMINTIDSYQGIEKDVIIISNARTQGIGFLANYQRLNVALTRPKKCLILCGNFKNLESVPSWASLLSNARERGLFHDISTADALDVDNKVIGKIKIKR